MPDVVARIGAAVDGIGGKWMGQPVMAAGAALGFTGYPWPFYMVGRGGVLGDVDPDVVAEAMVFPSPALVRSAWREGRAVLTPEEGVAKFIGCAYEWAPTVFDSTHDLARSVELLEKLAGMVDASDAPLAGAWRTAPVPSGAAERVVRAVQILREHRGGVHAACVLAAGLSPVEAVMATEGEGMAAMYGWEGPFPDPEACKAKKAPAESATNEKVGAQYAVLETAELAELAVLLGQLQAAALAPAAS